MAEEKHHPQTSRDNEHRNDGPDKPSHPIPPDDSSARLPTAATSDSLKRSIAELH
jgi:hypothetical protein